MWSIVPSRAGGNLAWKAADGSGEEERLTESKNLQTPSSISPDGKWVAFNELKDIWLLPLPGPGRQPQRFLSHLILGSRSCVFSPDGQWVAYGMKPDEVGEISGVRSSFPKR